MKIEKPILLFDGECKFCNFWVALIQRQKSHKKFRYFPLQSIEGKEIVEKHQINKLVDSILVLANGKVYEKSSAAFKIAKTIGGFWNLALIFWIIPKPIRNWLYDLIAKNRHRFFKNRESCEIHN